MKNVADYVNAEKRVFENREHAKRIYSEYGLDKDATSTRTLVTEGTRIRYWYHLVLTSF